MTSTPSCSRALRTASAPLIVSPATTSRASTGPGLDPSHLRLQPVGEVATRPLELPGGPVAPAHLQHVGNLLVADVEPTAQVHDLGGEVPVHRRARAVVDRVDGDLAGALPQDAGDDRAVSFELVAHLGGSPLCRGSPVWSRPGAACGDTKNPPAGGGHLARGSAGPRAPRAYAISTRTLRPVTAAFDMVTTVWGRGGRVSTSASGSADRAYGSRSCGPTGGPREGGNDAQAVVRRCRWSSCSWAPRSRSRSRAPGAVTGRSASGDRAPITDKVTDTGQQGDSSGDLLTSAQRGSTTPRTRTKIGHDQGDCIRISPHAGSWECRWLTYIAGRGAIMVEGAFFDKRNTTTGGHRRHAGVPQRPRLDEARRARAATYNFDFQLLP